VAATAFMALAQRWLGIRRCTSSRECPTSRWSAFRRRARSTATCPALRLSIPSSAQRSRC
jgi:hypothetical protein